MDSMTCPTITGEELQAARARLQLTRRQLADALGISNEAVIYRWETGRSRIQTSGLLARALRDLEQEQVLERMIEEHVEDLARDLEPYVAEALAHETRTT